MKIDGFDRQKILRQKSYHSAWFLHLAVKYVTFHLTWSPLLFVRKPDIKLYPWQYFNVSVNKTEKSKNRPFLKRVKENDLASKRNCVKKISFQSAHWAKWMKWDWWKLFKSSIRQNCNFGQIKYLRKFPKIFLEEILFSNRKERDFSNNKTPAGDWHYLL